MKSFHDFQRVREGAIQVHQKPGTVHPDTYHKRTGKYDGSVAPEEGMKVGELKLAKLGPDEVKSGVSHVEHGGEKHEARRVHYNTQTRQSTWKITGKKL